MTCLSSLRQPRRQDDSVQSKMENTLVVLLLLCALSSAQKDLSEGGSQTCVPCLSDVHAVLRDMSTRLGKYEVRMEQLQKENQEQAEHLKEQQNELGKLRTQVGTVTEQQQAGQVAFSASLKSSEVTLGPYPTHTPLIYSYVVSNIGSAYNPNTGVFTAPVKGAYHFEFYIAARGRSSDGTAAGLVKNEEFIFAAHENQLNGFGTAANGATLLLEAGDMVFMRLWQNSFIFDNENRHSTFSGHLLFRM